MSIAGLIVALILLANVLFWVIVPFSSANGDHAENTLYAKQRGRLLAYYERVLTNIRDLDEDHTTGKIQTMGYHEEREMWLERGVQVLKALDKLALEGPLQSATSQDAAAIDEVIDAAIEAAIEAQRDALSEG